MSFDLPSNVVVEEEVDTVGTGGAVDSNVYAGVLDLVYMDKSKNGAVSINIHFNTDGKIIRNTTYISNQAGKFTYNKEGKEYPLPGYSQMDSFFKAVTGKGIADNQTMEEKHLKVWVDGKEVLQPRKCFMDAQGKKIAIGVLKVSEEKTVKTDQKEANGKDKYVGTGEFRDTNEFDKYFDAETGLTNVEKAGGITEPEFLNTWKEKKVGFVKVKKAKNQPAAGSKPGAPAKPASSLFS